MKLNDDQLFKGFRFSPSIIQHAGWLYFTFPLSFRDVELLLAQRSIQVSHESIRKWCYRFGPILAKKIRQKRRPPTDKWHLDEVFVTINRRRYYLWRAVESEGMVLDILLQERRNAEAAKRFFQSVLESIPSRPRVIITDGLRNYNIISNELLPNVEHRRSKGSFGILVNLNNQIAINLARKRSIFARPYICRLSTFNLLTKPSVGPFE